MCNITTYWGVVFFLASLKDVISLIIIRLYVPKTARAFQNCRKNMFLGQIFPTEDLVEVWELDAVDISHGYTCSYGKQKLRSKERFSRLSLERFVVRLLWEQKRQQQLRKLLVGAKTLSTSTKSTLHFFVENRHLQIPTKSQRGETQPIHIKHSLLPTQVDPLPPPECARSTRKMSGQVSFGRRDGIARDGL